MHALPSLAQAHRAAALVAATELRSAAAAGRRRTPWLGRHLGLVCADPGHPAIAELQRASEALGARTSIVRLGRGTTAEGRAAWQEPGSLLGRLYDAVLCMDVPVDAVRRWRATAGVPVVAGLLDEWRTWRDTAAQDDPVGAYELQGLLLATVE